MQQIQAQNSKKIAIERIGVEYCAYCGERFVSDYPEIAKLGLCDRCFDEINDDNEIIGWRKNE